MNTLGVGLGALVDAAAALGEEDVLLRPALAEHPELPEVVAGVPVHGDAGDERRGGGVAEQRAGALERALLVVVPEVEPELPLFEVTILKLVATKKDGSANVAQPKPVEPVYEKPAPAPIP